MSVSLLSVSMFSNTLDIKTGILYILFDKNNINNNNNNNNNDNNNNNKFDCKEND